MSELEEAALRAGLAIDYIDAFHQRKKIAEPVLQSILDVIGLASMEDAASACLFFYEKEDCAIPVPAEAERWLITSESGETTEGVLKPGQAALSLPAPPAGYYTLNFCGKNPQEIFLIVTPQRCYQPWQDNDRQRVWGLAAQLYSLRSDRNWGIGDFTDLKELIHGSAALGVALVGVNPLHILFPDEPENASPYSPSSRQYLNWLYLDIEAVPEFRTAGAAHALLEDDAFATRLRIARIAPFVDYTAVMQLKRQALELLYQEFRCLHLGQKTERAKAFDEFRHQEDGALRRFALFQVLRESLGKTDPAQRDWRRWPADYQNAETPAAIAFSDEHREEIEFHEYLQFLVVEQLDEVHRTARKAGMKIGLYGDLAVGIDNAGSDAWCEQGTLANGLTVGAPPDVFNVQGQNWGISLFNPVNLRQRGYKPFVNILRAAMKHLGALRIDHVIGLMRLYCIPTANPQGGGAYLNFPFDDLARIVALESHRNRCLIIGEDLGTLPGGAQEKLADYGFLSYRLLWFEHEKGKFVPATSYPEQALAAISTHDLPTLAGFWENADIKTRAALQLLRGEQIEQATIERQEQLQGLLALLKNAALEIDTAVPPFMPMHQLLAAAPSRLLLVQLEDLLGVVEQVNMPATTTEHPNWRRKLSKTVAEIVAGDTLHELALIMADAGRAPERTTIDKKDNAA